MSSIFRKYTREPTADFTIMTPLDAKLPRTPLAGLAGCGKTVFAGGWLLSNEDKANYGKDFFCDVDEGESNIRLAVDLLKVGRFPPKTPIGVLFQALIYFKWKEFRGLKWTEVCAPVIDPAGEEWKGIIDRYSNKMYTPKPSVRRDLTWLQETVIDCDAVILVMDVTKAKGVFEKGQSMDPSYKGNPDTESARLLEAIMNYKAVNKRTARKLKGVLIALTKYDVIRDYLPPEMNLLEEDTRLNFLYRCFNHTWSKIMYRRIPNVKVVPIWFDVKKDENDQPLLWEDDGTPMISMDEAKGRPHFSYGSFDESTDWMKTVAG